MKLLHPSLIITAKGCWDSYIDNFIPESHVTVASESRWIIESWDGQKNRRRAARPAHGETDGTVRFNSNGYVNVNH